FKIIVAINIVVSFIAVSGGVGIFRMVALVLVAVDVVSLGLVIGIVWLAVIIYVSVIVRIIKANAIFISIRRVAIFIFRFIILRIGIVYIVALAKTNFLAIVWFFIVF